MQTDGGQRVGSTRLRHWNAGLRHDVHVDGPSVRPSHSHPAGYHTRRSTWKTWFETLDAEFILSWGTLRLLRALFSGLPFTCSSFAAGLLKAGEQGGTCTKRCVTLIETKQAKENNCEIQRMHRQELRAWKSEQISEHLKNPRMCKWLRSLERHPARTITTPPHPNDFADMLATLFAGNTISLERPVTTLEAPGQRSNLTKAIQRMKTQKAADECGLVAKLLKHIPEDVLTKRPALMDDLICCFH